MSSSFSIVLYKMTAALLAILIFSACLYWFGFGSQEIESIETYSGIYRTDGHRHFSALEPCGIDEVWNLTGNLRRVLIEEESVDLDLFEPLYVELRGVLSELGWYGHMDTFESCP